MSWAPVTCGLEGIALIKGAWGGSLSDLMAVGEGGNIIHWNGSAFAPMTSPTGNDLNCIWGWDGNHVWAGGQGGTLLFFNGTTWSDVSGATSENINCIWGTANNDIWAVGSNGLLMHWDGATWTVITPIDSNSLYGVSGVATDDIWAVGQNGSTYRYDGMSWAAFVNGLGISTTLRSVSMVTTDDGFVVGDAGVIAHWDNIDWSALGANFRHDFASVFALGYADIWVVGSNAYFFLHLNNDFTRTRPFLEDNGYTTTWNGGTCVFAQATDYAWAFGSDGVGGSLAFHWSGAPGTIFPAPTPPTPPSNAWLALNGIDLAPMAGIGSNPKGARRDIGAEEPSVDGTTRITRETRKRDVSLESIPLSGADALAWESLITGEGEVWSFDSSLYGSKGLGPSASSGATLVTSSPKFGAKNLRLAATTGTITYTNAALPSSHYAGGPTTFMVWRYESGAWHHYIIRSDGAKWVDGVRNDAAVTTWASISGPTIVLSNSTGSTVDYDDLVALPYLILDDWAPVFGVATSAFSPLPHLNATGRMVREQATRRVYGKCEESGVIVGAPLGEALQHDLRRLGVDLLEV